MANLFKNVIDRMMWAQVTPALNAHATGVCLASDLRNDQSRHPFVYQLASSTTLNRFNIISKSWHNIANPSLQGTFGSGTTAAFVPSFAAFGTIAAGATTTRVTLTTPLPAAVGVNSLAKTEGKGEYGFKLRIIDSTAGKTAERFIVGNTEGTTPTIHVLSSFGFTPSTGARYELLSGRVFMLNGGSLVANIWRSFEVSTATFSNNLSTTNLPSPISTDSSIAVLDEQYVPFNCKPGEGMIQGGYTYDTGVTTLKALTATASTTVSLTGQAVGGDAGVLANEYRNFQIRIVEDTIAPLAVGQRRIIGSHTAGASPVYTLGTTWTIQPSSSAKYVIEQPNLLLVRTSTQTAVYVYNYTDATINNGTNSVVSNAWSSTYFAAAAAGNSVGGVWVPSFGIQPDAGKNARHSQCLFFRGNAATLDVLDIAGAATGSWASNVAYHGSNLNLAGGTSATYSPFGMEGKYAYINIYGNSFIPQMYRFDVKNRSMAPFVATDFVQTGVGVVGNRMASYVALDGTDSYDSILLLSHQSGVVQELLVLS